MMAGWTMGTEAWLLMGAWALVMVLAVWLLIREPRRDEREDALETLRGRLARGEITPDEFERARRLLTTR
ncbi:MAG: SHOCT domain-containing protein [Candidatus Limnocylindrales bacterium]|jgi:uncharacterized membrane protein